MIIQEAIALTSIYRREEDFSADLANHLHALGVGECEDAETESNVGTRKADIVAVGATGTLVVENQFGKADWDHWGRLEAYARLKEANVAALVAESFEELMIVTCSLRNEDSETALSDKTRTGIHKKGSSIKLLLRNRRQDRRAKDGEARMSLGISRRLVELEPVVGGRVARAQSVAIAGAVVGMLFAGGRRTVTTWLRAAGISDDYQDYYYFLASLGRKTESVATRC